MTQIHAFHGRLSREEAGIVARALLRRQKGTRLSTMGIMAGVICLALGAFQLARSNPSGGMQWIVLGVVISIIAVALRISETRQLMRSLLKQEMSGSVESEGVRLVGASAETLFRWPSVQALDRQEAIAILWLTEGQAIPLAKGMFANAEAFAAAVSAIGERMGS